MAICWMRACCSNSGAGPNQWDLRPEWLQITLVWVPDFEPPPVTFAPIGSGMRKESTCGSTAKQLVCYAESGKRAEADLARRPSAASEDVPEWTSALS